MRSLGEISGAVGREKYGYLTGLDVWPVVRAYGEEVALVAMAELVLERKAVTGVSLSPVGLIGEVEAP